MPYTQRYPEREPVVIPYGMMDKRSLPTDQVLRADVLVIGAGAAGFFAALTAKEKYPDASVVIVEKTHKTLAKVRISGGGRCNVTHNCPDTSLLPSHYPRGEKELRSVFERFAMKDTVNWFASRGVDLKVEKDGRMFPTTDSSETIARTLEDEAVRLGIPVVLGVMVQSIVPHTEGYEVIAGSTSWITRKLIIATGGSPTANGLAYLDALALSVKAPVPSLFTFNFPRHPICQLLGVSVGEVQITLPNLKLKPVQGPMLITHWGISGPAVLRLSAWGARQLAEVGYRTPVLVNWWPGENQESAASKLMQLASLHAKKEVGNLPQALPNRLWRFLLYEAAIVDAMPAGTVSKAAWRQLATLLTRYEFQLDGKTTFKEEFVTCGGISLKEVDMKTMQVKRYPHLYATGEVLDIDGITGGFNFQAAWSTGYIAGQLCGDWQRVGPQDWYKAAWLG